LLLGKYGGFLRNFFRIALRQLRPLPDKTTFPRPPVSFTERRRVPGVELGVMIDSPFLINCRVAAYRIGQNFHGRGSQPIRAITSKPRV
jgi:hypothetical protein